MNSTALEFTQIPSDGMQLACSLHKPAHVRTPAPIVICCHGLTGTRIGTAYRLVALGRRLAEMGIACLRFDFRGCGESDGLFQDLSAETTLADLNAVIDFMPRLEGCDSHRVGVLASSFGAFTASRAVERMPGLRCAAFLAPVADPRPLVARDMTDAARDVLRRQGWIEHQGHRMGAAFVDRLPEEDGPTSYTRNPAPLLVIHGKGDRHVPPDHGRSYVSAARAAGVEAVMREMDCDDHGMRSVAATDAILSESASWFARLLLS